MVEEGSLLEVCNCPATHKRHPRSANRAPMDLIALITHLTFGGYRLAIILRPAIETRISLGSWVVILSDGIAHDARFELVQTAATL